MSDLVLIRGFSSFLLPRDGKGCHCEGQLRNSGQWCGHGSTQESYCSRTATFFGFSSVPLTRAGSVRGLQEHVAGVRAVNTRMTADTRLALCRLNVLRHGMHACPWVRWWEVAQQADFVYICLNQQLVIGSPMGEVASAASFGRDRSVLINEGSGRRHVAFGAHYELPGGRGRRILS